MTTPIQARLDRELLAFLADIAGHNDREWFLRNKERYETRARDPFLGLIDALRPGLARMKPAFIADPKPVGGSMMRIYRDTRFSRDKSPYKTAVAAHFRIAGCTGQGAPGLYLHVQPGRSMAGGGVWHPDTKALTKIRNSIVAHPDQWNRATRSPAFRSALALGGESLLRVPRGYEPDHPLAEDLRRKDYIFSVMLTDREIMSSTVVDTLLSHYARALPLLRFLAESVG